MLLSLAREGVAVFSPHTAFDNTPGGINEMLAQRMGLTDVVPLRRGNGPGQCKVVVFLPDKDLSRVSDALFAHMPRMRSLRRAMTFSPGPLTTTAT